MLYPHDFLLIIKSILRKECNFLYMPIICAFYYTKNYIVFPFIPYFCAQARVCLCIWVHMCACVCFQEHMWRPQGDLCIFYACTKKSGHKNLHICSTLLCIVVLPSIFHLIIFQFPIPIFPNRVMLEKDL